MTALSLTGLSTRSKAAGPLLARVRRVNKPAANTTRTAATSTASSGYTSKRRRAKLVLQLSTIELDQRSIKLSGGGWQTDWRSTQLREDRMVQEGPFAQDKRYTGSARGLTLSLTNRLTYSYGLATGGSRGCRQPVGCSELVAVGAARARATYRRSMRCLHNRPAPSAWRCAFGHTQGAVCVGTAQGKALPLLVTSYRGRISPLCIRPDRCQHTRLLARKGNVVRLWRSTAAGCSLHRRWQVSTQLGFLLTSVIRHDMDLLA